MIQNLSRRNPTAEADQGRGPAPPLPPIFRPNFGDCPLPPSPPYVKVWTPHWTVFKNNDNIAKREHGTRKVRIGQHAGGGVGGGGGGLTFSSMRHHEVLVIHGKKKWRNDGFQYLQKLSQCSKAKERLDFSPGRNVSERIPCSSSIPVSSFRFFYHFKYCKPVGKQLKIWSKVSCQHV